MNTSYQVSINENIAAKYAANRVYEDQIEEVREYLQKFNFCQKLGGYRLFTSDKSVPPIRIVPCIDLHLKRPVALVFDNYRNVFSMYSFIMGDEFYKMRYTRDPKKNVNLIEEIIASMNEVLHEDEQLDLIAWSFDGARFSFDKDNNYNDLLFGTLPVFRFHGDLSHPNISIIVEAVDEKFGVELGSILKDRLNQYDRKNLDLEFGSGDKLFRLFDPDDDHSGIFEIAFSCIPRLAYLKKRGSTYDRAD